ncbi:MAG: hypothetical protein ACFFAH_01505 [Promethearchaeota archaeon]
MAAANLLSLAHFWIMLIGIVLLTIAITVVVTHKPKEWFLFHKILAVAGILFVLIGLLALSGLNLFLIHAVFALIVFIWLIVEIIGGYVAVKKKDPNMRKIHIWMGRIVFLLTLLVVILGILAVIYIY